METNSGVIISVVAVAMSILALLFTVASFWWMNWRRGTLHVSEPRSFQAKGSDNENLVLDLPLLFYNDGAAPIIVHNLRLILLDQPKLPPLSFQATVEALSFDEEIRKRKFATQFVVRGRETCRIICEFQRIPSRLSFEPRSYHLDLQARLEPDGQWVSLQMFSLNVDAKVVPAINQALVACDNDVA